MSKFPPTAKKIAAVTDWWNEASYSDRVLALNTHSYVHEVAKEYADMMFDALPPDVTEKLIGSAK